MAGFFGLPCCAAWACVTWRSELESLCCGCRNEFKEGDDGDDSDDGDCSSDGDGESFDDEAKKKRGQGTANGDASAPSPAEGEDLEDGKRKSSRRQSISGNQRRKSGANSSSGRAQNGKETEETKDSFGGWEYSPAAASSRKQADNGSDESAAARRNSKLSGGRKRVSSAAASLFRRESRRESRLGKEGESATSSSRNRPSLFLGPSPGSASWVPNQASEGVAEDIARLKGLLRADDDACAAEAAQLRRLSHAGWTDQVSVILLLFLL